MCNYVELGQTCGAGLSSTFLMMRKFRRRVDGHVFLVVVTLAGRVSRCVRRSCRLSTNNAANHRDGDNHRPAPHLVVVTYLDLVKEDEPASQPVSHPSKQPGTCVTASHCVFLFERSPSFVVVDVVVVVVDGCHNGQRPDANQIATE